MTFKDDMKALAADLLSSDMLTPATITRNTSGVFDPVSGSVTKTNADIECRAVASKVMITLQNGAKKEKTKIICDTALKSGDKITIGALDYTIDEVSIVAPWGEAFVWSGIAK